MPTRPKEPPRYIAAIRPLSAYRALLDEALAYGEEGEIRFLLEWKVGDEGAFKFPHERTVTEANSEHGHKS